MSAETRAQAHPFERLGEIRAQIAGERTVSRPLNDGLILDTLETLADALSEFVMLYQASQPKPEPEPEPDPKSKE